MTDKNKVNVVIDGRNLTVVATEHEDYIRDLAYYVDQKIKNLSSKNDRLSQTMAATLAALNIADEYYKANSKLKELEQKAKKPLEKFDGVSKELEDSKARIAELEKINLEYKDDFIREKLSKENLFNEMNELKEKLELAENEISELHKLNKSLQDKNFENQLELIEAKKERNEALKSLNKDKR